MKALKICSWKKIFDPMISYKLYILCQTKFPCNNAAAKQFMEIISGVIKSVFRRNRGTMQKINIHIPYDKELHIAKRLFKKYKGQLFRYPNNTDRRIRFIRERRLYKKLVYKVKKKSQELRLYSIYTIKLSDRQYNISVNSQSFVSVMPRNLTVYGNIILQIW